MNNINKLLIVFMLVIVLGIWITVALNPKYSGPEFIEDPLQIDIENKTIQVKDKDGLMHDVTLLAEYSGEFAVQGTKRYHSDGASSISPVDFILSWGDLPKQSIDGEIAYSQSNRWFYYKYDLDSGIDGDYVSGHVANTHIIPSDEGVAKAIKQVSEHDYIYLEGYLVTVHFDGASWVSSKTRTDVGNGSCEILYVTQVTIY